MRQILKKGKYYGIPWQVIQTDEGCQLICPSCGDKPIYRTARKGWGISEDEVHYQLQFHVEPGNFIVNLSGIDCEVCKHDDGSGYSYQPCNGDWHVAETLEEALEHIKAFEQKELERFGVTHFMYCDESIEWVGSFRSYPHEF